MMVGDCGMDMSVIDSSIQTRVTLDSDLEEFPGNKLTVKSVFLRATIGVEGTSSCTTIPAL